MSEEEEEDEGEGGGGRRRTVLLSNTDENTAAGFRRTPPLGNRIYCLLGRGGRGQWTPSDELRTKKSF